MTEEKPSACCKLTFEGVVWWAMLLVAVLAIPAVAVSVMLAMPEGDTFKAATFIVTCWGCTWLGMWLVAKSKKVHTPKE
jgi:hypothetical protein